MIGVGMGGFNGDLIARLEIGGFHLAHSRKVFRPTVDLHVDGAVFAGIERQIRSGNGKQHSVERFGGCGKGRQGEKRADEPARHFYRA